MVRASTGCVCDGEKKPNGNCPNLDDAGLPLQCVHDWALEKHDYLKRYIEATAGPRSRYLPPHGRGGAAYIDLFAGPGRARVQETGKDIDGSPLFAVKHDRAPFTKLIFCDWEQENADALAWRTMGDERVRIIVGDCAKRIEDVVAEIPPYGLNFTLIDPFGPAGLRWTVLERLASIERLDLLIHFPTGAIKRNFENLDMDLIVGTTGWRRDVKAPHDVPRLIDHLRNSLVRVGYTGDQVRSMGIKTTQQLLLYHLVFISKHPLGNKIWESITKTDAKGQRSLF
jgi:three-Cys-motif partner protein